MPLAVFIAWYTLPFLFLFSMLQITMSRKKGNCPNIFHWIHLVRNKHFYCVRKNKSLCKQQVANFAAGAGAYDCYIEVNSRVYLLSSSPEPSPVSIIAGKRKADSPAPIHFRELPSSAPSGWLVFALQPKNFLCLIDLLFNFAPEKPGNIWVRGPNNQFLSHKFCKLNYKST